MGTNVTMISTSPIKQKEALENLGADLFLVSRDQDQLQAAIGTLDGIIDTVSTQHPLLPLLGLLKSHEKLMILGIPGKPFELQVFPLIQAEHNIKIYIEVIAMDYLNTSMDRLLKDDVKYRFVIDTGNTLRPSS
ncbi:putative mannitol dehydrogenase [Gossypium arboreum]|uniref:Putative mannitol dehydrogenase n=1 Tax=Gossypium arboreum TaxID=29729 RepID=A0A0B0PIQ6_GOSAR|nr:putative mannitol dehydrogenase [Gossypium arboreum]